MFINEIFPKMPAFLWSVMSLKSKHLDGYSSEMGIIFVWSNFYLIFISQYDSIVTANVPDCSNSVYNIFLSIHARAE